MVLNPDKCSFMLFGVDDELQMKLLKAVNKTKYKGSHLTANLISQSI